MSATAEKKEAMRRPMMERTEEGAERRSKAMIAMTSIRRRRGRRQAAEPAGPRPPDRGRTKADADAPDSALESLAIELESM